MKDGLKLKIYLIPTRTKKEILEVPETEFSNDNKMKYDDQIFEFEINDNDEVTSISTIDLDATYRNLSLDKHPDAGFIESVENYIGKNHFMFLELYYELCDRFGNNTIII